jgi:DNA-binding transcriptional LysR family regulator
MDTHLLRTFTAVVRHASFSAAARELGYTQSAVSQHISTLESDLGVPLLERRPVAVTDAGARLLEHAEPLLTRLAAARADVVGAQRAPADRLTLGVSPLAAAAGYAGALARLRAARPRVRAEVRVMGRASVAAGVAAGTLDLGVVDGSAAPGERLRLRLPDSATALRSAPLPGAERPLEVALPLAHPLAGRDGLGPDALAEALWIDAPDAAVPPPPELFPPGGPGPRAAVRYQGTDVAGLLALVAAGHGVALLPHPVPAGAGVVGVPLTAPRLAHRTELLRRGRPAATAAALVALLTG